MYYIVLHIMLYIMLYIILSLHIDIISKVIERRVPPRGYYERLRACGASSIGALSAFVFLTSQSIRREMMLAAVMLTAAT